MNDVMKKIKPLEESGLLIKDVYETIKNETKEQRGGFLEMALSTLGASLLGIRLTGKGTIRAGEGTIGKIEIENYYQKEPKFNVVYSRNDLAKSLAK